MDVANAVHVVHVAYEVVVAYAVFAVVSGWDSGLAVVGYRVWLLDD